MQAGSLIATVDIGSNSFRLEIGRLERLQWQRVDYVKETVRLGNGLDEAGNLTAAAMERGWDCLARMGDKVRGFPAINVRAVATQTLREARNRDVFLARGARLLGFPIDVIAGAEEARLIYLGVAHLLPPSKERRLVVDIGGRSTEIILGRQLDAQITTSIPVGSVAWSMRYFPEGALTQAAFDRAESAARTAIADATRSFDRRDWEVAYGSSGTAGAVGTVLQAAGGAAGMIERKALDALHGQLVRAGHVDQLDMAGLKADRKAVIGGGMSLLRSVFDVFGIDAMRVAQGALRQGVVFDMQDREALSTDPRDASVAALARRCGQPSAAGRRGIKATAMALYADLHGFDADGHATPGHVEAQRELAWAAELCDAGRIVAEDDAHKHGAYIVEHADLPGFTVPEQKQLAQLVLSQRGKLRKVENELTSAVFRDMAVCLRLAVLLADSEQSVSGADVVSLSAAQEAGWRLQISGSAQLNARLEARLKEEALAWQKTDWPLRIS